MPIKLHAFVQLRMNEVDTSHTFLEMFLKNVLFTVPTCDYFHEIHPDVLMYVRPCYKILSAKKITRRINSQDFTINKAGHLTNFTRSKLKIVNENEAIFNVLCFHHCKLADTNLINLIDHGRIIVSWRYALLFLVYNYFTAIKLLIDHRNKDTRKIHNQLNHNCTGKEESSSREFQYKDSTDVSSRDFGKRNHPRLFLPAKIDVQRDNVMKHVNASSANRNIIGTIKGVCLPRLSQQLASFSAMKILLAIVRRSRWILHWKRKMDQCTRGLQRSIRVDPLKNRVVNENKCLVGCGEMGEKRGRREGKMSTRHS
ncbi:uncharacterized protein [Prorops nasuta]|uniref:uncharacterized protein n=1 Tax=Prorops nasuta TaxID=863751 RepID=UPI0034CD775E